MRAKWKIITFNNQEQGAQAEGEDNKSRPIKLRTGSRAEVRFFCILLDPLFLEVVTRRCTASRFVHIPLYSGHLCLQSLPLQYIQYYYLIVRDFFCTLLRCLFPAHSRRTGSGSRPNALLIFLAHVSWYAQCDVYFMPSSDPWHWLLCSLALTGAPTGWCKSNFIAINYTVLFFYMRCWTLNAGEHCSLWGVFSLF